MVTRIHTIRGRSNVAFWVTSVRLGGMGYGYFGLGQFGRFVYIESSNVLILRRFISKFVPLLGKTLAPYLSAITQSS